MNKQDRISEILEMSVEHDLKSLKAMSAKEVRGLYESIVLENEQVDGEYSDDLDENGNAIPLDGEELAPVTGSRVKESYRKKYAAIAKEAGHVAKTSGGRSTLNNGDELALLLESADPTTTCAILDLLLVRKAGTTLAKYTTDRIGQTHPKTGVPLKALNDGMVRMNAGNQIRSYCKKLDVPADGIAEVKAFLASLTA